jgi:hypothetical protein
MRCRIHTPLREDLNKCHISLSAPGGGEGRVRWGEAGAHTGARLTLPSLRDGPLPLPPKGGEGLLQSFLSSSFVAKSCVLGAHNRAQRSDSFHMVHNANSFVMPGLDPGIRGNGRARATVRGWPGRARHDDWVNRPSESEHQRNAERALVTPIDIVDNGGRPRNPPPLHSAGRGFASGEVTMRLAILSTLGLLVALAGCSISGECRRIGYAPDSPAYQSCVSSILQQRNDISNQLNERYSHGSDGG